MENKDNNSNGNDPGRQIDKLIKLGQAEQIMKKVMSPVPSRPTLIAYIKKNVLKGQRIFTNYYIYESSLNEFINRNKNSL